MHMWPSNGDVAIETTIKIFSSSPPVEKRRVYDLPESSVSVRKSDWLERGIASGLAISGWGGACKCTTWVREYTREGGVDVDRVD